MKKRYTCLTLIILLALSPLVRFSIEDTSLPRDTNFFLVACILTLITFFFSYHYRVQSVLRISFFIALLGLASAFLLGLFPPQAVAILYWVIALCLGIAMWIIRTHNHISRNILIAILVGCIGIYAQWGIAQFVVQHDLGLHAIGESRLAAGDAGVASFSHGYEKYIRSYGPFAHSNSLAGSIVLGTILLYTLRPHSKLYISSILLIFSLSAATSFSRAGLAGFVLVLLAFIFQRRQYWIVVITLIPLLLFTPLLLVRSFDPHGVALEDRVSGIIWMQDMATPKSLLRGYGIGNYERALTSYLIMEHIPHNTWDVAPVHSAPLLLFSELGATLSGIFAFLLYMFFRQWYSPTLLALMPPLILDHYFTTQLGASLLFITCIVLVVQYRGGHRTH